MTYGPTSEKATGTYAYDVRNRLESVSSSDGSFARFNYDVENERTYQKYITPTESKEIKYFCSRIGSVRNVLVREVIVGNSTKTTYYIYGLGLVYEINEDGTSEDPERYYHYDQIGSTVALTDSTGSVTDRYSYNVWGKGVHYAGKSDTPFMYVGAYGIQTDPNGLINMRARYYNTVTMSFITSDPSGFDGGLNWYLYANGSPLMYIDENGEFAFLLPFAPVAIGGIVGVVSAAIRGESLASGFVSGIVAGAVTSGVIMSGGTSLGVVAAAGALGSASGSFVRQTMDNGFSKVNWVNVGKEALVGGVAGGVMSKILPSSLASETIGKLSAAANTTGVSAALNVGGRVSGGLLARGMSPATVNKVFADPYLNTWVNFESFAKYMIRYQDAYGRITANGMDSAIKEFLGLTVIDSPNQQCR